MGTLDVAKVGDSPIDEGQIRAQVEKICGSTVFRRSGQSQKFLTYICDLTLRGRSSEINEYLIGLEVFHRGPDYSTAEDAIVRRQAHTLRSKLDSYYANEGQSDFIRIELPIGHYEPVFRVHRPEPVVLPVERPSRNWRLAGLTAGAIVLAAGLVAAGWALGRASAPVSSAAKPPDAVQEIWGPWLRDPNGATICLSNSNAAVVHFVPDGRLKDAHPLHFRPRAESERALRKFFGFPDSGYLYYRPSELKTGVADD